MTAHLLVDGARIEPERAGSDLFQFRFRLPAQEVRLISGSARPVDLGTSPDDRRLGVELRGMRLTHGHALIDVPIDAPGFFDGFYPFETHDDGPFRWTTGDAALPLSMMPPWRGEVTLRLKLREWDGSEALAPGRTEPNPMAAFESLGEDCEFGLAQRGANIEPRLTLLRWAGTSFRELTRGLEYRFLGLGDPESTEVVWSGTEYFLRTPYLSLHTNCLTEQDEAGLQEMLTTGRATMRILRRKLLRDIVEARRIFLFASQDHAFDDAAMRRMYTALRRIGAASLLCVRLANEDHAAGSVEHVAGDLYAGYVTAFVKPNGPFDEWSHVCARTLTLRRLG